MMRPERTRSEPYTIRPYTDDWLAVMRQLAPILRVDYPAGDQWLSRRLDDIQDGCARGHLAFTAGRLIGVAIETPKPEDQVKLSTLWVAPDARRQGVGHTLLDRCIAGWLATGTPRSWITVGPRARVPLTRLTAGRGFREMAMEPHRYGPERHEWVLLWTPEQYLAYRSTRQAPRPGAPVMAS